MLINSLIIRSEICRQFQIVKKNHSYTRLIFNSFLFSEILSIDECMWHELAVTLGYNRYEIQNLFSESSEPINEILAHYLSRGGDEDEFSNAMYKVAQLFKILPVRESKESQDNKRIEMQRISLSHRSNFGENVFHIGY